jgi:hypothetical protein
MSIEKPRPALFEADVNADVPFYIPAAGPETRPRRTLKHDDSFLVIDAHGDIGASAGNARLGATRRFSQTSQVRGL